MMDAFTTEPEFFTSGFVALWLCAAFTMSLICYAAMRAMRSLGNISFTACLTAALLIALPGILFGMQVIPFPHAKLYVAASSEDLPGSIRSDSSLDNVQLSSTAPIHDVQSSGTGSGNEVLKDGQQSEALADAADSLPISDRNIEPETPSILFQRLRQFQGLSVLICIWIAGAALILSLLVRDGLHLRRLVRRIPLSDDPELQHRVQSLCEEIGVQCAVDIRCSNGIGPFSCAMRRPTLVLPLDVWKNISFEQRDTILIHELVHLQRCDPLWNLVHRLVIALYWFIPIVRAIALRFEEACEEQCDRAVIKRCDPLTFGEALYEVERLRFQQAPSLSSAVFGGRRCQGLESRIARLLSPEMGTDARGTTRVRVAVGSILIGIPFLLGTLHIATIPGGAVAAENPTIPQIADDKPGSEDGGESASGKDGGTDVTASRHMTMSGRVVDRSGAPVPDAMFFMVEWTTGKPEVTTELGHADAFGRFQFELKSKVPVWYAKLWIYSPKHCVGCVAVSSSRYRDLPIVLGTLEPSTIQVTLPTGEPAQNVQVAPEMMHVPNGVYTADEPTGLVAMIPDAVKEKLTRTTDHEGNVVLDAIPQKLRSQVHIRSDEYGEQSHAWKGRVALGKVGSLSGKIRLPDGTRMPTMKLNATTIESDVAWSEHQGLATVDVQSDGSFSIPKIMVGKLSFYTAEWPIDWSFKPYMHPSPTVSAGKTIEVMVDTKATVTIHGVFRDKEMHAPVAGAYLSTERRTKNRFQTSSIHPHADENGRFSARVFPGVLDCQLIYAPLPYKLPGWPLISVPEGTEEVVLNPIEFEKYSTIKGTLVDENNLPIAGRTVLFGRYYEIERPHQTPSATNEHGEFEFFQTRLRDDDMKLAIRPKSPSPYWWLFEPEPSRKGEQRDYNWQPMKKTELRRLEIVSSEPLVVRLLPNAPIGEMDLAP